MRSMLINANKELLKAKEEITTLKARIKVTEEETAAANRKATAEEARADAAENRLKKFFILITERGKLMKETIHGLKEIYIIFEKITFENMEIQLEKLFNEFSQWILNAYTWRAQSYATGNDISKSQIEIASDKEEGKEEVNNDDSNKNEDKNGTQQSFDGQVSKEIKKVVSSMKACQNFKKQLQDAIKDANPEDIPLYKEEIRHIAETEEKETENTRKKSPGRQRVDRPVDQTLHADEPADKVCSACGKGEMKNLATIKQGAISAAIDTLKLCNNIQLHSDVYVCPHCGHVHGVFPKDADLPVQPDMEVSINTALFCVWAMSSGIPLHLLAKVLKKAMRLGNSTLLRSIITFADVYLVPFCEYLYERERKAKYLMADGTPFRCLESQNLGNCMNKNPDRKRNHNEPAPVPVEEGKSNYILCCCSVPDAEEPFVTYHFLPIRSYDSIAKVLTPDHNFDVLITDAFQAYDKLAAERKCAIQNCLVHFRRYVVKAANLDQFSKDLVKMEEQQQIAFLKEMLQKGTPHILLCCVFLALSKIYSYESSFDRTQPDYMDKILEVRQKTVLPLMNDIDKVMNHFVDNHTDPAKNGEGRCERRGDPYSKAAIYWHNNHDKFRSFLDDPMIPPDTNIVEQNIRTATIIRKNSYFMTSQKGMNTICTILTVIKSLYQNGIENPVAALTDYCRALYSHCFDEGYTRAFAEGNDPGKKLTSWDMRKLSKNFDFKKYFDQIFKQ